MQILLPLGGHVHPAEPGCLCTKQALGACASKLLEPQLGTHRRTSYLLTASGVGTRSPTAVSEKEPRFALQLMPGIHSQLDGLVDMHTCTYAACKHNFAVPQFFAAVMIIRCCHDFSLLFNFHG